jgi:hypothetical protein
VEANPVVYNITFDRVGDTNFVVSAAGVVEVRDDLESFRTLRSRPL